MRRRVCSGCQALGSIPGEAAVLQQRGRNCFHPSVESRRYLESSPGLEGRYLWPFVILQSDLCKGVECVVAATQQVCPELVPGVSEVGNPRYSSGRAVSLQTGAKFVRRGSAASPGILSPPGGESLTRGVWGLWDTEWCFCLKILSRFAMVEVSTSTGFFWNQGFGAVSPRITHLI